MRLGLVVCAGAALALAACGGGDDDDGGAEPTATSVATGPIVFASDAFESGQPIPVEYSCDGENMSPRLDWTGLPAGTQSLAVEMIDPDAGGFVHWVIFDIPADLGGLPGEVPHGAELSDGSKQAINTSGEVGYSGPCPPSGQEHEYLFRVYALDEPLGLEGGGSARSVQGALAEHTLAMSELAGTFSR